ncbi:MAG TPA: hypothetical protein VNH39_13510 [Steroidobacteraceae bacterium]|nr:hypothetical protein [Steroidobacteraceae bacterium]
MTDAMRIVRGLYWTVGGYEILHDDGPGGTGHWVVLKRGPGSDDNPRAFCATLRDACLFIAFTERTP